MNHLETYLDRINALYRSGIAREHSYRGDLQTLLSNLAPDVQVTNEPARIECGAPDYIITKKNIPVGYIEAKDIGADLGSKTYKEQFDRYKKSLANLIITDYLDFQLFRDGEFVSYVSIGSIENGKIRPHPENFETFIDLTKDFCTHIGQTIKSANKLSRMMAGKARLLAKVIENALTSDETEKQDSTLKGQYKAFQDILIHDIKPKEFADIYAQTIAYGMFAARLHDPTLDTFSRQEAAELIPKTNPFLRKLFQYIAGYDLDDRIRWIVDALADIFRATNVAALLKDFGKATQQNDPIIHFYETFLAEYDPKLRKSRGVWYTPEPVVNFIVRAVDDILKTEFNLPQGLADTSKTTIEVDTQVKDSRTATGYKREKQEVHKVQILDPATGTGTFLAEVVKHIHKRFEGQQGIWSNYVEEHLIPRLNGFEILMASYAMAHLKLDLLLTETGYKPKIDQRFKVYLTNSLEEHHPDTGTLFASWLSNEASEANYIKRDTPVMVVLGNPPYSGESANKGDWIMNLMEGYKKEPGGKEKLKERNPKWINDDYVKFLRYGQNFIEKNGEGILAFINPHGFLDNPTFRGMRWNLLKTYDKIYILDLHGNANKKETCPDGSPDVNIFDILQGVSINFFIKTGKKNKDALGQIYHCDLFGGREAKYKFLWNNSRDTVPYRELPNVAPMYYMVHKDFEAESQYRKGFSVQELFPVNNVGVVTSRDAFVIDENKNKLKKRIEDFFALNKFEIQATYDLKENKSWKIEDVQAKGTGYSENSVKAVNYRPFDTRYIYYDEAFIERSRKDLMQHFLNAENVGLMTCRQTVVGSWEHVGVTKLITDDSRVSNRSRERGYIFPLYLHPESEAQQTLGAGKKSKPNLDTKIVEQVAAKLKLTFIKEKEDIYNTFAPIDLLDYIYAVLHSPAYRLKFNEFLKIDFPRVPYPKNQKSFLQLVGLGGELRQNHLLEGPKVLQFITTYPQDGDNTITRKLNENDFEISDPGKKTGRVWINDVQYFDGVPEAAWSFYVGGYQPAQKWLKDRKGRKLSFDEILHYQKIIVALTETDRIMQEIDEVDFM